MAVPWLVDLSGTWKLNVAESFLSREHPADDFQLTRVIEQTEGAIKITEVSKHALARTSLLPDGQIATIYPDGKEHEAQVPPQGRSAEPTAIVVKAEWQGGTLAIMERGTGFLGASTTHRRYFLSKDGMQLIEQVEGYSLRGDTEQRLVFDKQT